MRNYSKVLLGIMIAAGVSGCARDMKSVNKSVYETSNEINANNTDAQPVRQAYADVDISVSLKTHKPGIYIFDNKKHGTDEFEVIVHIDGKPLQMKSSSKEEDSSYLGEKHPEAGKGIRYNFTGSIRLEAGKHMVTVSIPEDNISVGKDIYIKEGSNRIVIEPVYNRKKPYKKIGFAGDTSFYEGIKGFKVVVNGNGE